jgi:hypothetical protein
MTWEHHSERHNDQTGEFAVITYQRPLLLGPDHTQEGRLGQHLKHLQRAFLPPLWPCDRIQEGRLEGQYGIYSKSSFPRYRIG